MKNNLPLVIKSTHTPFVQRVVSFSLNNIAVNLQIHFS